MLMVASLGVAVHAQPQAPIEWQPVRLLMDAPDSLDVNYVYAKGDTIVLVATREIAEPPYDLAAVSISGNNGQTWSPWHVFRRNDGFGHNTTVAFTSQGVLLCTNSQGDNRGFFRTTDLGASWTAPLSLYPYLRILTTRGDTVFCTTLGGDGSGRVTWTTNGGISFAPLRLLNLPGFYIDDLAVSDSVIVAIDVIFWGSYPYNDLYYTSALRVGGAFPEPHRFNPQYVQTYEGSIEMDPDGFGMIISWTRYESLFPGYGAILLNQTHDHGVSWSEPDTLCPTETACCSFMAHRDHLWVITWVDTIAPPPYTHWGMWYTLSANRGRSWYPRQHAFEFTVGGGDFGKFDVQADAARLYGAFHWWNGVRGDYFFQWEGIIHPDTLPPFIALADSLPSVIAADTVVMFRAEAQDNDSLWKVEVVLRRGGGEDSIAVPLSHDSDGFYRAAWPTVFDASGWLYYYRAEDMWENVSYYPPEGPASPWVVGFPRDTVPPVISEPLQIDSVVECVQELMFECVARDNDRIERVVVFLYDTVGGVNDTLLLNPGPADHFRAFWVAPYDTGSWFYAYQALDRWGNLARVPESGNWSFHVGPLSASDDFILHPTSFSLSVFPNPFNATAEIRYVLPRTGRISLRVYDMLGREVAVLADQDETMGEYRVVFDAAALPSGIYFLRVQSGSVNQTRKLLLLK